MSNFRLRLSVEFEPDESAMFVKSGSGDLELHGSTEFKTHKAAVLTNFRFPNRECPESKQPMTVPLDNLCIVRGGDVTERCIENLSSKVEFCAAKARLDEARLGTQTPDGCRQGWPKFCEAVAAHVAQLDLLEQVPDTRIQRIEVGRIAG